MNILITGASGFIGKHLFKQLTDNGNSVSILVRANSKADFVDNKQKVVVYRGPEDLSEFLTENKIDGIIHLATLYLYQHKPADISDLINSNITFGTQVLDAACQANVKWFINTGTLFQHFNNDAYNPVNLYAATKQAFEDIAKFYYTVANISFATLKLNDTYGPNDTRKKIFNIWKEFAESGQELKMSPGNQRIDILYISDVVKGFELLVQRLNESPAGSVKGDMFSLPSNERITLKQLAGIYEAASNKKLNINWGGLPYRSREVMEPASVQPLPGWKQDVDFLTGINLLFSE